MDPTAMLGEALSLQNLVWTLVGTGIGLVAGCLRGVSPAGIVALALPVTFVSPPLLALAFLASVAIAAQFGRSFVVLERTADGGTSMTAMLAPLIGMVIAFGLVVVCLPSLTELARAFGPVDYASAIILLLVGAAALAPGSFAASMALIVVGMLLGLAGTDLATGSARMTFGVIGLADGFGIVPVAVGLFVVGDVIAGMARASAPPDEVIPQGSTGRLGATLQHGVLFGLLLGLLPGSGAGLTTPADDSDENDDPLNPAGKADAERAANVAAAANVRMAASFLPLLSLGMPTNAVAALLAMGFMINGIVPGPNLGQTNAMLIPTLLGGAAVGLLAIPVLLLVLRRPLANLATLPFGRIGPAFLVAALIAAHSPTSSTLDVGLAIGFGLLGYLLSRARQERGLIVIGMMMAPMLEEQIRRTLLLSRGDLLVFVQRPISTALLIVALLFLMLPMTRWRSGH